MRLILTRIVQPITMGAMLMLALALLTATLLAAFAVIPWPELSLIWNGAPVPDAGMWAMIGLTALALGLCAFLPTNGRVQALEKSHRNFHISMHDVAHAYFKAHSADRDGVFRMSHEFDAVRERIAFLRKHPDLDGLEPDILEAAAQMSQVSQELAQTYSEDNVNRARAFLKQRQEEIEKFNDRLGTAKVITTDLRQWLNAMEMEESIARSQLDRLLEELDGILPALNLGEDAKQTQPEITPPPSRVEKLTAMPSLAEAMMQDDFDDDYDDVVISSPILEQRRAKVVGMGNRGND